MAGEGYLNFLGTVKNGTGTLSAVFELTARAKLAMFIHKIDREQIISRIDEQNAETALAALATALAPKQPENIKFSVQQDRPIFSSKFSKNQN